MKAFIMKIKPFLKKVFSLKRPAVVNTLILGSIAFLILLIESVCFFRWMSSNYDTLYYVSSASGILLAAAAWTYGFRRTLDAENALHLLITAVLFIASYMFTASIVVLFAMGVIDSFEAKPFIELGSVFAVCIIAYILLRRKTERKKVFFYDLGFFLTSLVFMPQLVIHDIVVAWLGITL